MYLIHIKQVATGIVRRHGPLEGDWETEEFIWTEGNFACDCNRALFWARAGGDHDIEQDCGDAAYRIRVTDDTSKVFYNEFED